MQIPEEYKKTVKSALNMLAYAENTKKGLENKLLAKGYSPESVEFALEYVESKRLLDEKRYFYRLVETLAKGKCYGERRIRMELIHKGFDPLLISECFNDALSILELDDICFSFALKNYKGDREKLYAKLIRMGHPSERAVRVCKKIGTMYDEYEKTP